MSERYYAKRKAGISPVRVDGSLTSPENDRQAAAAEEFACERFGAAFNGEVYDYHGDGGHDFVIDGKTVEVVWLGINSHTHLPRYRGNLIVNPHEPQRWAALYVIVVGSIERGFSLLGCAWHGDLHEGGDFGYGPRLYRSTDNLRPFRLDEAKNLRPFSTLDEATS